MLGSWMVEYEDGTYLAQHGGVKETPTSDIDWSRVKSLRFESDVVVQTFSIVQPPEGYWLWLRRRVFRNDSGDSQVVIYMLCTMDGSVELDHDDIKTYEQACKGVTFWIPNGVIHQCPFYNCKDVAHYCSGEVHDIDGRALMPMTHALPIQVDSVLT